MNSKWASIIIVIVLVGIGFIAWKAFGTTENRIEVQKASIYDATGEPLPVTATFSDAITWQPIDNEQCLGINVRGQAVIGATYRKVFSFSKSCKTLDVDVPTPAGSNIPDSERFWFGNLVGNQCFSVVSNNAGVATSVFVE
jgi:hypothetical protein